MKVTIGNIAESLGAYLIPAVDTIAAGIGAAITAFQTGEVTADGFAGAMEGLGVALRRRDTSASWPIVGDVAGFFIDLPGPVQAGVVAFAAFSAAKGPVSEPSRRSRLKALYTRDSIVAPVRAWAG